MKKLTKLLMLCAFTIFSCSCGAENVGNVEDTSETTSVTVGTSATEETTLPVTTEKEYLLQDLSDTQFNDYVSNTLVATGNNYVVESANEVTYRAYFPVEQYGELEYCFYFSNTVDSTYKYGELAYAGRIGEEYTIKSAYIADGGTSVDDEITNRTPVTFGN